MRSGRSQLARLVRIALDIEQVVDDLERESEVLGVGGERVHLWRRAPAARAPPVAAALKSTPVLRRWMRSSRSKVTASLGGQQVVGLAADQPARADGLANSVDEPRGEAALVGARRATG